MRHHEGARCSTGTSALATALAASGESDLFDRGRRVRPDPPHEQPVQRRAPGLVVRHLASICTLVFAATAAMAQSPTARIPDESAGIDGIAQTLITLFDQFDILALGEAHGKQL